MCTLTVPFRPYLCLIIHIQKAQRITIANVSIQLHAGTSNCLCIQSFNRLYLVRMLTDTQLVTAVCRARLRRPECRDAPLLVCQDQ